VTDISAETVETMCIRRVENDWIKHCLHQRSETWSETRGHVRKTW